MKKNKVIRYIGSKEKLLDFISDTITASVPDKDVTFVDGFTGTGVVSKYFYEHTKWNILAFDLAEYSGVFVNTIKITTTPERVKQLLTYVDSLDLETDGDIFNEFSYGGTPKSINDISLFAGQPVLSRLFFSKKVGQKIDTIRKSLKQMLEAGLINEEEKNIILLFTLSYADRNANTTSVYGAYLKRNLKEKEYPFLDPVLLTELENRYQEKKKNKVSFKKGDIISCLKKVPENSIIYFDPPYNTRRYESNYHILNYIVNLEFNPVLDIKLNSKTGMSNQVITNLFGSLSGTKEIFESMITLALSKNNKVFISYNNEGVMTKKDIVKLCKKHGYILTEHSKKYKKFTAGEKRNNEKKTHVQELIWEITNVFKK